jgi:hypothetical protein
MSSLTEEVGAAPELRGVKENMRIEQPLKQILSSTRGHWDRPATRNAVRQNFEKVINCRTPALGAEVYASETEEKLVYHTCKSRACPSCGHRATELWQREQGTAVLERINAISIVADSGLELGPEDLENFLSGGRDLGKVGGKPSEYPVMFRISLPEPWR